MNILQRTTPPTEYFDPSETGCHNRLAHSLSTALKDLDKTRGSTVVLCIGTDRATGDTLGPITGSLLQNGDCGYKIYGTLRNPVHALNLKDYIRHIYNSSKSPTVIAIDASLGNVRDVGRITLSRSPLQPGIGVNKKLPPVGDIAITGIVNLSGKPGLSLLQSTRLYSVMQMSRCIADAILLCDGVPTSERISDF